MAVFDTSRALSEGARFNPASPFGRLLGAVLTWNDRRLTRKALSSLTTRELNDIGLHRGDISGI